MAFIVGIVFVGAGLALSTRSGVKSFCVVYLNLCDPSVG